MTYRRYLKKKLPIEDIENPLQKKVLESKENIISTIF